MMMIHYVLMRRLWWVFMAAVLVSLSLGPRLRMIGILHIETTSTKNNEQHYLQQPSLAAAAPPVPGLLRQETTTRSTKQDQTNSRNKTKDFFDVMLPQPQQERQQRGHHHDERIDAILKSMEQRQQHKEWKQEQQQQRHPAEGMSEATRRKAGNNNNRRRSSRWDDGYRNDPEQQRRRRGELPLVREGYPACSCYNETSICCVRSIHRGHKMGFMMVKQLFTSVPHVRRYYTPPNHTVAGFFAPEQDYYRRTIIVVRDYLSAVVSGYLYHKAGRECTSDPHGKVFDDPNHVYRLQTFDFTRAVRSSQRYTMPPAAGRHLCQYLAEESIEHGLSVFVEVSLYRWYIPWIRFTHAVLSAEGSLDKHRHTTRTAFVCFEQLNDPATQRRQFHDMMDFLYPGRQYDGRFDPTPVRKEYTGAHATEHDPELRSRLRLLAATFDRQYLNGILARESRIFGCDDDSHVATTTTT